MYFITSFDYLKREINMKLVNLKYIGLVHLFPTEAKAELASPQVKLKPIRSLLPSSALDSLYYKTPLHHSREKVHQLVSFTQDFEKTKTYLLNKRPWLFAFAKRTVRRFLHWTDLPELFELDYTSGYFETRHHQWERKDYLCCKTLLHSIFYGSKVSLCSIKAE